MQITIVNNSDELVLAPDGHFVPAGGSATMVARSKQELVVLLSKVGSDVIVTAELDGVDFDPVVCDVKDIADPVGGVNDSAGEGFDILDLEGAAANVAPSMYFGVFSDAACTQLSTTATVHTATTGTIVSGSGTSLAVVTPSAAGVFACTVTDTEDETVYVKAWQHGTKYVVDTSDTSSITFS